MDLAKKAENPNTIWRGCYLLGHIHFASGNPEAAYNNFVAASTTAESIRALALLDIYRRQFYRDKGPIFDDLILLAVQIGRQTDAWRHIERSRGRTFLDLQAESKLPPPSSTPRELANFEAELLTQARALRFQPTMKPINDIVSFHALQTLMLQLDDLWTELSQVDQACADYVELRRAEPLSFESLRDRLRFAYE